MDQLSLSVAESLDFKGVFLTGEQVSSKTEKVWTLPTYSLATCLHSLPPSPVTPSHRSAPCSITTEEPTLEVCSPHWAHIECWTNV